MKLLIALVLSSLVLTACTFSYEVSVEQGGAPHKAEVPVKK